MSPTADPSPHPPPLSRALIERERRLMLREWVGQSVTVRYWMIGLCLAMGGVGLATRTEGVEWATLVGMAALALVPNGWVRWRHRRDAVRRRHLWGMLALDTLFTAVVAASLGSASHLALPFYIVMAAAYGLNRPRAARLQLGLALACYPIARAVGLLDATGEIPAGLLLVEVLCLGALGWMAISGPIRFTYRVRGARRALGALAGGDFDVRLPARALDDLGFLGVSFNDTAERLGEAVRALEGEIAERRKAERQLEASKEALQHLAFHDPLTGLPNRARFRERLDEAIAIPGSRTAVLAVDLDGFKSVNDTFGHAAGDRLLVEVARRLLAATRGTDLVTRLGGDEFIVLLPFLGDEREAVLVAERILRSLAEPVLIGDRRTTVGASVGIAVADAAHAADRVRGPTGTVGRRRSDRAESIDPVDALLHEADVALYDAKRRGKGCWSRFDPAMVDAASERRQLQSDLRLALERGEMDLQFQPIVPLGASRELRLEALIRWRHPARGLVPPATFIPLAEESGLVDALGRWVLATACEKLAGWQAAAGPGVRVSLTVNVSGCQLQHPGFVDDVREVLQATRIDPSALVLELTESAVIHQREAAIERMRALKALGVRLAIDDFGTGYSSLAYLQHFPIDVLKIDRSFAEGAARGGPQGAVVQTIVALGRALALETVAEGIETEEQRRALARAGCGFGQGYLFARPMDAADVTTWLAARAGRLVADRAA